MSDISVRVEIGAEPSSGSRELGARMRSLLEWERAFLAEQQYATLRHDTTQDLPEGMDSSAQYTNTHEAGIVLETATASDTSCNPRRHGGISGQDVSGLPNSNTRSLRPSPTTGTPVQGATSAGTRNMVSERASVQQSDSPRHSAPKSAMFAPETPGMLVTVAGDVAQLWLRQPGYDPSTGLGMIVKLRELLIRAGLRLSSVTVNGMLRWSEESAVMESLPNHSEMSIRVDKRV